MNLIKAWEATFTRRWHRDAFLAETHDPISAHSGRVALLALMLFPTRHALHRAAILHDMGEAAVGDVSWQVKRDHPDLREALERIEREAVRALGLPDVDLDAHERDMLELCDRLDAYLWARHHKPEQMADDHWITSRDELRAMAWRCNVGWILLQMGEARA